MTIEEQFIPRIAMATDVGRRRATNEDRVAGPEGIPKDLLARKGYLCLVADGIGGYKGGDIASQVAVEAILKGYYEDSQEDPETSLRKAFQRANQEVHGLAQQPEFEHMGCTLVAAVVLGERALIAHVGDSRAYLVRGRSIHRLTEDHSWVAEQVRQGLITPRAARNHPYRHVITRSIGAVENVDPDVTWVDLQPGDQLVLCTDGLTDVVSDRKIGRIAAGGDLQGAVQRLIAEANKRGGPDNISVCVVEVGPQTGGAPAPGRTWGLPLYAVPAAAILAFLLLGSAVWLLWPRPENRPAGESPLTSSPEARAPTSTPSPLVATATATPAPVETVVRVGSPTPVTGAEAAPTPAPVVETPKPVFQVVPTATPAPSPATMVNIVYYIVQWGDTLSGIACRYGTAVEAIRQANNLTGDTIYVGQALVIPGGGAPAVGAPTVYIVQAGDTLFSIALRYGVTVEAIKSANGLGSDFIYVGQRLVIPGGQPSTPGQVRYHVVQPGDTLLTIAVTYGTTVDAIVRANGLPNPNYIWVGQRLIIP